jgi:hypothetical protein
LVAGKGSPVEHEIIWNSTAPPRSALGKDLNFTFLTGLLNNGSGRGFKRPGVYFFPQERFFGSIANPVKTATIVW